MYPPKTSEDEAFNSIVDYLEFFISEQNKANKTFNSIVDYLIIIIIIINNEKKRNFQFYSRLSPLQKVIANEVVTYLSIL
ncbi:hypothetical protein J5U21_01777 [Saccharolobus shibatae]|uniref:Uncharacterized protein n=1 Tax=Saccharolobus shibatae TaxID=2286 RepID=A0A8F5BVM6_9CREN|nr:hypothetical protein J5U21_01777 [Saccharolobus shibatae]